MTEKNKAKAIPLEEILGPSARTEESKCDQKETCLASGPGCTKSQSYSCPEYKFGKEAC